MPSKKLTDCVSELMQAYLVTRETYEAQNEGHVMVVDCTWRSASEQMGLFQKGRQYEAGKWVVVNPGAVVTQIDGITKKSNHNYEPSRAVDFHIEIFGKTTWDVNEYLVVGALAQENGLVWGGTWGAPATLDELKRRTASKRFIDAPHLELPSNG